MTPEKLKSALKAAGIKSNDTVLLHSSLLSIGNFSGSPEDFIETFLELLAPEGTLAVPVFGALGVLTEVVKRHPDAIISSAPVGTIAAIGAKAQEICSDHWRCDTAHGEGSPYLKIAEQGGYICLLGVDQDRNTTLHSVEALLKLPYLSSTSRTFTCEDGKEVSKTYHYYPGPHRNFIALDKYFKDAGIMKTAKVGNAVLRLIKAKEMIDLAVSIGEKNPTFVLCDNPACADCVKQKAAIFADKIASLESFKLSASSKLAGYYVPEIIDRLKENGIQYLELDYLQGKAAASLSLDKLTEACRAFRAEGIEISALRLAAIPAEIDGFIEKIKAAEISKVILPFPYAQEILQKLSAAKIAFSFVNTEQNSADFNKLLNAIKNTYPCKSTLNPVNFVKAFEHPFLHSWNRGRFIKHIEQLDIVDAKWDTCPTRLAEGNAEIKELISIIRCHNFQGFFTLGAGATYPGTLKKAVEEFNFLLNTM